MKLISTSLYSRGSLPIDPNGVMPPFSMSCQTPARCRFWARSWRASTQRRVALNRRRIASVSSSGSASTEAKAPDSEVARSSEL